jgi:hypothetical protein
MPEGPWVAYLGPEQATNFKTKEEAMDAIAEFVTGKPDFKLGGVAAISYYPIDHKGTQK